MSKSAWRTLGASVGAVTAAAAVGLAIALRFDLVGFVSVLLVIGIPIAGLHAAIIGGPLYAIARQRWRLGWRSATLGGLVTGILPIGAIFLFYNLGELSWGAPFRWDGYPELIGTFGISGAIGGAVFRAIRGPRPVAGR